MRTGLKNKLIRVMLLVGALPLLLAMVISYVQGTKSLKNVIGSSFKALAYETAAKIDFVMDAELARNARLATHPTLVLAVQEQNRFTREMEPTLLSKQAEQWSRQSPEAASLLDNPSSRVLQNFLNGKTLSIQATEAIYVTDAQGVLVGSSNNTPPFIHKGHGGWRAIFEQNNDSIQVGNLHFDPKIDTYVFDIAVPIRKHDEKPIGIFHRVYDAKQFFASSIESIIFGETGHVMLITSEGVVIDCPILPTGFKLSDRDLVKAVTGPEPDWAVTQSDGHGSEDLSIIGYSPLNQTNKLLQSSSDYGWYTFAWQASHELFAPTQKLFLWISAAGLFSVFLIALMGSIASNKIVTPVRTLQNTATRIGKGEQVEPLEIHTGDEIESLADEINTMNEMLQKAFTGLEDKVREKSQEALYFKEYSESILRSVPESIIIFNENLKIEYINSSFEKLTGKDGEGVIGKSLEEANLEFHENWKDLVKDLHSYSEGDLPEAYRKLEGRIIACYEPSDPLAPKGPQSQEAQPILTLGDREFMYQFFEVAITVEEKRRIGLLLREITEEKALRNQLTMAEKLSGLGTLAAGIAHEMNNPLYSIMGFTEAIIDEKDPSKIKMFAQKVLDRSRHMASVILNLSGYSRSGARDESKDVNINERLDAALEIAVLASYTDGIELEKNYGKLPLLKAKPEEIQQIFLNILANAVQAMEGTGKIILTSHQTNGNIVVSIKDNGPGIPVGYLSKVFDPFFTTKQQGEGSGLGLNIVHRLVQKYGGQIEVDSKVGEGSTFIISFPQKGG